MTEQEAFELALNETMPPMDEAAKLRWWFAKGAAFAIESGLFSGECRDEQTGFFAGLAQSVWEDVRLQEATPREALSMIYRAGGDHRIEAEILVLEVSTK